jgi:FMN phosphatase YigB (HAD superfamily)
LSPQKNKKQLEKMDTKIKNLMFDLGGVIMDIKRENCVSALIALGMADAEQMVGNYIQSGEFCQLENGDITPEEFRGKIREHIPHPVTDEEINDAFNAFLIGIPVARLKALRELRKTYKIYLLSNTNQIMFDSKIRECFRAEKLELEDYFDGVTVSYLAHCSKPSKEIFDYAIAKFGIKPEETLFFDDGQVNLDEAAALGFKTRLVPPGTEFMEAFGKKNQ